ncbi:hypothetical protein QA860_07395 [Streptomyces stelliscabiei]|uniref:hypothetical protein n=1 Tax=Streptomyces stelliscabiei TaxID=146820 RepID=UPI002FF20C6E
MPLTDASLTIAITLGGLALGAAIVWALVSVRRPRYRGPFAEPYAGFQAGARAHADTGEFLQLECEGHCPGATAHEVTSVQGATCVLCATHRALPDFVDEA